MGEGKDGLIRGGDFDRRCENVIRCRLSHISIEEFTEKCKGIGGRKDRGFDEGAAFQAEDGGPDREPCAGREAGRGHHGGDQQAGVKSFGGGAP